MKRVISVLVVVAAMLCSTAAFADEGDFGVSVSLKGWYNKWEHSIDFPSGSKTWDNGSAFMVGPAINFKLGPAFLGVTYLQSTSSYSAKDWFDAGNDTMEFDRKDLDLTLGVMFGRHFGMFVGYKSIDAPMKYTNLTPSWETPTYNKTEVGSWTMKGPGFGILANATIGSSAAFYGNLAFMKVKQQFEYKDEYGGPEPSFDMSGVSLELGFALAFTEHFSSNIGLKYQAFSGTDDAGYDETHTFSGPTLGLNLSF